VKADVNTTLHTKFLLQIWKQQENSAILLASNKQHYKEKTQNQNTWQNRLNTQERTARKNIDQGGLQQAPNLQDYQKFRTLQMLKFQKGIFIYWATL